jgi:hypothetical protein
LYLNIFFEATTREDAIESGSSLALREKCEYDTFRDQCLHGMVFVYLTIQSEEESLGLVFLWRNAVRKGTVEQKVTQPTTVKQNIINHQNMF